MYYKILNKSTKRVEIVTKAAKEAIERQKAHSNKYQIIEECDVHGRPLDFNNFLTKKSDGTKPISIGIESGPIEENKKI